MTGSVTGHANTSGTCLAATGTSASPIIVIGGSDTNKFALWTFQHGSSDQTQAFNSIPGDTVVSVAVNSSGNVFATGTSQTLYSGSFYYQNTSTIESTLTGSTLGAIGWTQTLTGLPNQIAAGLPTGYPGVDGAQQVIIDPSSNDGKPIVLCTNQGYAKVLEYPVAGGSPLHSTPITCCPPNSGSGKTAKSWLSHAVSMQASPANNNLYVVGMGLESQANVSGPIICDYTCTKLVLNDNGSYSGTPFAFVWPTSINGTYNWDYSTTNGSWIVTSAMTVYRDSSNVDHVWITGGYVPTLSTAYTIAIN
jgi:hypothetical protein